MSNQQQRTAESPRCRDERGGTSLRRSRAGGTAAASQANSASRTESGTTRLPTFASGGMLLALAALGLHAAPAEPAQTRRASGTSEGVQANGASSYPSLSSDGRFVAFTSEATNLVALDQNDADDVFVKDMATGELRCASLSVAGHPGNGASSSASISGDGQRVAFASSAADLVAGDTNQLADVFVRDLAAGTTVRLSVGPGGVQADGASSGPRLSADGRWVAFSSRATNLVAGDANGVADVFVCDLQTGAIERASLGAGGAEANGPSEGPALSADGRFVAFASVARNLIPGEGPGAPGTWNVYVRDRANGTTVRASARLGGGNGDGHSFEPALSGDGRWVAFTSYARDLVAVDTNARRDVYLRDLLLGTTLRVSLGAGGAEPDHDSSRPALSADGRFVAFESSATNLATGAAPPGSTWVFVHDRSSGITARLFAAPSTPRPDGGAGLAAISADGRFVACSSGEPALVAGDTNEAEDVFVRGPLD